MSSMKGLDPLVASVVLVIIAVAVAATVANWQSWFLPSYAQKIGEQSRTQLQCARAGVSIDNITFDCRSNCLPGVEHTLTASIRNTGDISLPLYSLVIESTAGGIIDFQINSILALDQTLTLTNTSTADCTTMNRSVAHVSILTACSDMPSTFDGSIITWVNC